jgi:hypothetical protein
MELLEQLKDWVKQKNDDRSVEIKIDEQGCKIFVYDYSLLTGQFINDVSEINLEQIKAEKDCKQFEILKNKFKGE